MVGVIRCGDVPPVVEADRREQWNSFVSGHSHGHFMQLWEWGEIRRTSGWEPHYLAVESKGELDAVALVLTRAIPGLGTLLYTPRGPLWNPANPDGLRQLVAKVQRLAQARRGLVWRIDPYVTESEASVRLALEAEGFRTLDMAWSYWNQPKYVMLLSLEGGKPAVLSAIDRRDRYKIRYAPKHGVAIERAPFGEKHVDDFHRLMTATARKKAIPVRDRDWYSNLLRSFGKTGQAELFFARVGEEPVSAGISIRMGTRAWLMYLGSDYSAKLATWALQWDMVAWAADSGCTVYDFRGTATNFPPSPHDKGYGVYQFKKSFGPSIVPLAGYFDRVFNAGRYRLFRYAERRLLPLGERGMEALTALRRTVGRSRTSMTKAPIGSS